MKFVRWIRWSNDRGTLSIAEFSKRCWRWKGLIPRRTEVFRYAYGEPAYWAWADTGSEVSLFTESELRQKWQHELAKKSGQLICLGDVV